jgi:hypothetical protein
MLAKPEVIKACLIISDIEFVKPVFVSARCDIVVSFGIQTVKTVE